MICKYCGSPLAGNLCTSCKKTATLSYTSHELADLLGIKNPVPPVSTDDQLQLAYKYGFEEGQKSGFDAGQKKGFTRGFDSAQKKSAYAMKKRWRFIRIVAIISAVVFALLTSVVTGVISYKKGYQDGAAFGRQEQQTADNAQISGTYQNGYSLGHQEDYQEGDQKGLFVTFTPAPTPEITPEPEPDPTPEPFVLTMTSEGEDVYQLQQQLITLGYLAENEADGDFGSKTEKAVMQFQSNNGIEPTGIVDQDVWELIMSGAAIAAPPDPSVVTSAPIPDFTEESFFETELDEELPEDLQPGLTDFEPVIEASETGMQWADPL